MINEYIFEDCKKCAECTFSVDEKDCECFTSCAFDPCDLEELKNEKIQNIN